MSQSPLVGSYLRLKDTAVEVTPKGVVSQSPLVGSYLRFLHGRNTDNITLRVAIPSSRVLPSVRIENMSKEMNGRKSQSPLVGSYLRF